MNVAALASRLAAVIVPSTVLRALLVSRLTLIPMPTPISALEDLSEPSSVFPWICTVE